MIIYIKGKGLQISPHFKSDEILCNDGTEIALFDTMLIYYLQKIREHFNAPVTVTSAFRTAAHNKSEGGSPTSLHMKGMAVDIKVKGHTPLAVAQYAETLGLGGIGLYDTFTHIDTREVDARWDNRGKTSKSVAAFSNSYK